MQLLGSRFLIFNRSPGIQELSCTTTGRDAAILFLRSFLPTEKKMTTCSPMSAMCWGLIGIGDSHNPIMDATVSTTSMKRVADAVKKMIESGRALLRTNFRIGSMIRSTPENRRVGRSSFAISEMPNGSVRSTRYLLHV